ncbi:MAG: hypothetical protein D6788_09270, partial [Planctomycetota bacterium]
RLARLRAVVDGAEVDRKDVTRIADRLRIALRLDDDLSGFYETCAAHPTLHVLPKIGAGRLLRCASMTENILKAICGTNVNWNQAVKMINRIAQLGPIFPHFRNLHAWPTPEEILRAGRRYLVDVCRVGYRAESILALCRDVCAGRFDPEELDAMARCPDVSTDDLLERLRSVRGVGPATAHALLGFLGRSDRLTIDTATIAHVRETYHHRRRPTARQIERRYARYGRWKNRVLWYELWLQWATARQMLAEARIRSR